MTFTHRGIKVLGTQPLENVIPHIVQSGNTTQERKQKTYRTYHVGGQFFRVKMSGQRMSLMGREQECACCGHTGVLFRLESSGCYQPHFNLYGAHESGLILMTMDHIKPRSSGGNTLPDNLQLLCKICNEWKKNRPLTIEELRKGLSITDNIVEFRRQLAVKWHEKNKRYKVKKK